MSEQFDFPLTNASIDQAAARIEEWLSGQRTAPRDRLRIRLSLEDILLNDQGRFGEAAVCTLRLTRQFGSPCLTLELPGERFDPLPAEEDEFGGWSRRMLGNMGLCPVYSYVRDRNRVVLKLKRQKKRSPLAAIALAAALGAAAGLLGTLLPREALSALLEGVLDPVYHAFFGILDTIAGPMVFLAVAYGIYGVGDIATLSGVGKRMLLRFLAIQGAVLVCTAGLSALCFPVRAAARTGADASLLQSVLRMLLDVLPTDVVSPFLHNNSMQLILLAAPVGCALLILGERGQRLAELVEQMNALTQLLMELVGTLLPGFIFLVAARMFWTDSLGAVVRAWRAMAVYLLATALLLAAALLAAGRRCRVSPALLWRKCWDTFAVAMKTISSSASFDTMLRCCEERFGIGGHLSSFGIPLGMVFYTPAVSCYFLIIDFHMAAAYGVEISLAWVVMAALLSAILAVAAPPVPGGSLACYTVMFLQLGIPGEALVAALTVDVFFDVLATASDMVLLELELLRQGRDMGLVDQEALAADAYRKK